MENPMPERGPTNGALRAVSYLRKSTDRQEHSIDRQRSQVEPYARKQGYRLLREYADEGVAGDVFDRRPEFQKMLKAAQAREFDCIVVDEPSRLSRQDPVEFIEKVVAPLRHAGVRVDCVSTGLMDYTSLAGVILTTVAADKSSGESKNLSRRVLSRIADKAPKGVWVGGIVPYGLRAVQDGDYRKLVLGDEEEVRVVRFIFDAVANRGWSVGRVCKELTAQGVKPPAGNGYGRNKARGLWNRGTVRRVLGNRKCVGDLPWNETHQGKCTGWKGGREGALVQPDLPNKRTTRHGEADVIVVPDAIPALVGRDTFARAQRALAALRKDTNPKPGRGRHLLTHLLVCGDCDAWMVGTTKAGRRLYVCSSYQRHTSKACHYNQVGEAVLQAAILPVLNAAVLHPGRLDEIEAEVLRQFEAERASGEAERLQKRAAELAGLIGQGNRNLAVRPPDRLPGVVAQVRAWEAERQAAADRLAELENGADEAKALLAEARRQLRRLRGSLDGDDPEAVRAVLRELLVKVEVRYTHRKWPSGRARNTPRRVVITVRPGLGLSRLETSGT
jgi:site-specific DNA recombinase